MHKQKISTYTSEVAVSNQAIDAEAGILGLNIAETIKKHLKEQKQKRTVNCANKEAYLSLISSVCT